MVPVVPFESFEEYDTKLCELIDAYGKMVEQTVRNEDEDVGSIFGDHHILRWSVRARWLDAGLDLFLTLTKGLGKDWCQTINTMVVHNLETAYRIFAEFCEQSGNPHVPIVPLARLLKREVGMAIANPRVSPNNMCLFEEANFQYVHLSPPGWMYDPEIQGDHLPAGKVLAMKLAFAMAMHARLGAASGARILCKDNVKMILSDEIFL